jgi:2-C-methyl-D-erythritol 4-phosphate cytidylyltransferase/2-C-methyl-D-erythritol 2,4-cyclodiphosphate synthase
MRVTAIIAAGGRGTRLAADRPKQFLEIAGHSLLELSVSAMASSGRVDDIVVAVPADHVDEVRGQFGRVGIPLVVVAGGRRRQDSVANALASVPRESDVVLVHDAARPFVSRDVIGRTIDAAASFGAAIAAMPVRDTVKQASAALVDGSRVVHATLRRDEIFLAQTPQAFRRSLLEEAFQRAGDLDVTDEAMLAERAGFPVHLVAGDPGNIKVTTPDDLERARERAQSVDADNGRPGDGVRIGTGYDLHRLVAGRPLVLGGVTIPFDRGLEGHSDADVLCHAVTDAILGAAAAGDIGRLFPDTDPQWLGADSIELLEGATSHLHSAGFRVVNVDATVIAQRPKLLPYLDAMRANLATALRVTVEQVSVKGKTNEGVDSVGQGDAMACHAVALVARASIDD